jgi:hypothetical protein
LGLVVASAAAAALAIVIAGSGCANGNTDAAIPDTGPTDCPPDQKLCNGACVDPKTDPDNCGKCGNA